MKCQCLYTGKKKEKKIIIILSSAEFAHRVVKVKSANHNSSRWHSDFIYLFFYFARKTRPDVL